METDKNVAATTGHLVIEVDILFDKEENAKGRRFESRRRNGYHSRATVVCCPSDLPSRGILLNVVCLSVIVKPRP